MQKDTRKGFWKHVLWWLCEAQKQQSDPIRWKLLHFKGKLHFIKFFLWALLSCVGTIEDQKRTNYTGKERGRPDAVVKWTLLWSRQHQADTEQKENNRIGRGKWKKWFGPHLSAVKEAIWEIPLSSHTQLLHFQDIIVGQSSWHLWVNILCPLF